MSRHFILQSFKVDFKPVLISLSQYLSKIPTHLYIIIALCWESTIWCVCMCYHVDLHSEAMTVTKKRKQVKGMWHRYGDWSIAGLVMWWRNFYQIHRLLPEEVPHVRLSGHSLQNWEITPPPQPGPCPAQPMETSTSTINPNTQTTDGIHPPPQITEFDLCCSAVFIETL